MRALCVVSLLVASLCTVHAFELLWENKNSFLFNVKRAQSVNISTNDVEHQEPFAPCLDPGANITSCSELLTKVKSVDMLETICHVQHKMETPWLSNEELQQEMLVTRLPFPIIGGDVTDKLIRLLIFVNNDAGLDATDSMNEEIEKEEFWSNINIYTSYFTFELREANIIHTSDNQVVFLVDVPRLHVDADLVLQVIFGEKLPSVSVTVVVPYSSDFTWCGQLGVATDSTADLTSAVSTHYQACKQRGRYFSDRFAKLDKCDFESQMESWVQLTPPSSAFKSRVSSNKCACYYKYSYSPLPFVDPVPIITLDGSHDSPVYVTLNYFTGLQTDAIKQYSPLEQCTIMYKNGDSSSQTSGCLIFFSELSGNIQVMASPTNLQRMVSLTVVQEEQQHRITYTGRRGRKYLG